MTGIRINFAAPAYTLRAMSVLSAGVDRQHRLNGVLVEQGQKGTVLVSTDGHALGAYRLDSTPQSPAQAIIPRALIASPHLKGTAVVRIDGNTVCIESRKWMQEDELIDGLYPDWRRVIPKSVTAEPAKYNPSLLLLFQRVRKLIKSDKKPVSEQPISVHYNGSNAALVYLTAVPDFIGAVMPWVIKPIGAGSGVDTAPGLPDWIA